MDISFYQKTKPDCKNEGVRISSRYQKKIDCFNVGGYCDHCKTAFEAMECFYHYCLCQETRLSLSDRDLERGNKRQEMDDLRQDYIREKRDVGTWGVAKFQN